MNRKVVFGISAVVLAGAFFIATSFYRSQRAKDLDFMAQANASTFVREHSPTRGDDAAKVYIVEFTDPACETCAAFSPLLKQVLIAYPGKVKLVIRYAPFHQGSVDVVKFLAVAKKHGQFWEGLDALYASQEQWTAHHQVLVDRVWPILESARLDVNAIRAGMNDPEIDRIVQQDLADAQALGVRRTPGIFVNGKPLEPFGARQFRALVDAEVREKYPESTR